MKVPPGVPLKEMLMQILEDEEGACMYLNVALEENGPQGFLHALKNVIEARDYEMSKVAQSANISRQHLYKMLSDEGNPRWENVNALLLALGFKISVELVKKEAY